MVKEYVKDYIGKVINKYEIIKYIGSGSFGDVYEARDRNTDNLLAIKIPIKNSEKDGTSSLIDEAKIYKKIANPEQGVANVKITKKNQELFLVMDLLGCNLEKLIHTKKKLSLKSVIYLAIKMIDIMKYIHSCGYIHRDMKPENFVLGNTDKSKLYCIDYGLAKRYLKRNGEHIEFTERGKFCGTARYASIAAHKHYEQSRKDDLESLGYILVYLYKGKLPWQSIISKDKNERYKLIGENKEKISAEELCSSMPREFCIYLKYVKNLDFDEKPHYSALKKMFQKLYESRGYKTTKLEWE